MSVHPTLPAGVQVFERGWLSANNILLVGPAHTALVDSGYFSHAEQTLALVQSALGDRPLDTLVNTHLHSDHCGGNARLQAAWPGLETLIPPGQARHVRHWDAHALSYTPTGQHCPPFACTGTLVPGDTLHLGAQPWQVHAAPGHDPHSVILFEPGTATLLSADALWENGFGVVFPELEGESAFAEVAATLDLIERLAPRVIIPGHGRVFTDVAAALSTARRRLDGFVAQPRKHSLHAAKVLLVFKLLEWQRVSEAAFLDWAEATPFFSLAHQAQDGTSSLRDFVGSLLQDLQRSGALRLEAGDCLST